MKKQFNPKSLDIKTNYHLMISGISPRPIAFVSSVSLNNEDWLPGKVTFSDYSNGLESHILCVKQNSSEIEYCWKQGEYFWWVGRP